MQSDLLLKPILNNSSSGSSGSNNANVSDNDTGTRSDTSDVNYHWEQVRRSWENHQVISI